MVREAEDGIIVIFINQLQKSIINNKVFYNWLIKYRYGGKDK